jgi:tetratricopeptide (TPR) repeat protein
VPELRATDKFYEEDERLRRYASAWAAVQALSEGDRRQKFDGYLTLLHSGRGTEEEAFKKYFAEVDMQSVHELQVQRLSSYETERRTIPGVVAPPFADVEPVPMAPAQVHLMFSRLMRGSHLEEAQKSAERAAALEPRDPEARMMAGLILLQQNDERGLELLETAYELSGRKPRYAAALIRAVLAKGRNISGRQHIVKKLAQSARSAQDFEVLTYAMLRSGHTSAALHFAKKGLQFDRGRVGNLYSLAAAYASKGNFTMAYDFQLRAVNLSGHLGTQAAVTTLREYGRRARMTADSDRVDRALGGGAPSE